MNPFWPRLPSVGKEKKEEKNLLREVYGVAEFVEPSKRLRKFWCPWCVVKTEWRKA